MNDTPEQGFVVVGVDRLIVAAGLLGVAGFAVYALDDGWCCAVPAVVFAGMLGLLVWSENTRPSST